MTEFGRALLLFVSALFPIVDPLGGSPIFLALTEGYSRETRRALSLRIALNSYRAAGSGGYGMFRAAKVVWRSNREIRDLMVEYFGAHRPLPARPDGNWRIVPPRAVETLVREEAAAP